MDRLERLVNLVAALLETPHPLTREQIHQRIEGYSDEPDNFRRNFERDKELLRQMGLPLTTLPVDPSRPDEVGYRIRREEYELPDPGLDEDELAALRLAAAAVQVDTAGADEATTRALQKLGGAVAVADPDADSGIGGPVGASTRLAELPGGDAVAVAYGAIADRRRLRFRYRGETRRVDPWRLSFRRGQWYLAGLDHGRAAERLFRLDRVEGEVGAEDPPGAFERPPSPEAAPAPAWRLGDDEEVVARLMVDAGQARWAETELGEQAVAARRPDGSVLFEVLVTNRGAFRSFVLGFLDHAELLGPPELRQDLVEWLAQMAGPAAGA